jgi:hypothetical protein
MLGFTSIALSMIGSLIFYGGVISGHVSGDYGHAAIVGFLIWSILSLVGIGCAITELWNPTSKLTVPLIGLFLCSLPFFIVLCTLSINSHNL